jgi:polar amino acid transport system substrate-binding protein
MTVRMRMRAVFVLAAVLVGATPIASGCASDQGAAGARFEPATPGVLTVATAFLPAPGFWQGNPPTRGFEAGLATALARRLGLASVAVVQVPFASLVHGRLAGADIALSQLAPTGERERVLDFTTPYLTAPAGVLARVGIEANSVQQLQKLRWVVSRTSTLTPTVRDRIRPNSTPIEVEDRTGALHVLRSGKADALLLDLPVALGLAHAEPSRFRVLAQLPGGHGLAAALPDGSPNREIVDSAIRHLQADGTIGKLTDHWLGASEDDVPLILTEDS